MIKGQVISGEQGKILIRQKSGQPIELGELLIAETDSSKILLQVSHLLYGSQLSQQNLELISGMALEEQTDMEFMDPKLRNYNLAVLKTLITLNNNQAALSKTLPGFFSNVREITNEDLKFLSKPSNPMFIGKLRSGSKVLDLDINLDGKEVLSHHILIPATTGRGKSNLVSTMVWGILNQDYCGILVLDPHDEYYGRHKIGLKDHPKKNKVSYYTPNNPPPGAKTLKINLELIKPQHFEGSVAWSDPQLQSLYAFYKHYGDKWIESIILEKPLDVSFREETLAVIKRRILALLDLEFSNNQLSCQGIFDLQAGSATISEICKELEDSKTVIIDTSDFSGSQEILIGSLIATEVFNKYKYYKTIGKLPEKSVISIILEEAPRVLGKEVLEKGPNIFSTIAREGRKFKVGLIAITQLPSLIPRQILANINTKIILGIEMQPERQAIIDSASQDLTDSDRNIASLDKGEAIITSNFTKFATPVKIPLFEDFIKQSKKEEVKRDFSGIK